MIQPHPDAPLGSVATLPNYNAQTFPATSACLCRNTAPLITFAFDLLRRGVACHVVGRDIAIGLEKLVDKIAATSLADFRERLQQHGEAEFVKLLRKGKKQQAENYADKCQAVQEIAAHCVAVSDIKLRIAKIFESGPGVTLSTIHKAKGLEWETVFLLDWGLLPSRYAETAAEQQQEKNLQYVAITRAKLDLRFINSGNWN